VVLLERTRRSIAEAEECIERVDNLLDRGLVSPRNDRELAMIVGISVDQLGKVREYITTGRVSLNLGNCPRCDGWGGWDDHRCGGCRGTGNCDAV
jgi:hypothetical protein